MCVCVCVCMCDRDTECRDSVVPDLDKIIMVSSNFPQFCFPSVLVCVCI